MGRTAAVHIYARVGTQTAIHHVGTVDVGEAATNRMPAAFAAAMEAMTRVAGPKEKS